MGLDPDPSGPTVWAIKFRSFRASSGSGSLRLRKFRLPF